MNLLPILNFNVISNCIVWLPLCFHQQKFNVPVVTSETGEEYVSDSTFCTYFVLSDFESSVFEELDKAGVR